MATPEQYEVLKPFRFAAVVQNVGHVLSIPEERAKSLLAGNYIKLVKRAPKQESKGDNE